MPQDKANDQLERMSSFFFMITPRNLFFLFIVIPLFYFNNQGGVMMLLRKAKITLRMEGRSKYISGCLGVQYAAI